jgi:Iron-sulphur cluster biosynthesis
MTDLLAAPRTRRPRPQVVTLTDAAADRVKDVMARTEKPFLRVGIKNGGCAGMEYVMAYADGPDPLDEVVEDKGVQILVASNAILCSRTQMRLMPAAVARASPSCPPLSRVDLKISILPLFLYC